MRKIAKYEIGVGVPMLILLLFGADAKSQASAESGDVTSASALRNTLANTQTRQEQLTTLWRLADVFQRQGQYREALRSIERADNLSETKIEQTLTALRWGGIATSLGRHVEAAALLKSVSAARGILDEESEIVLDLELGRLAISQKRSNQAIEHYDNATVMARRAMLPILETKSRINALRARMDNQDIASLEERLTDIRLLAGNLEKGDEAAFLLLASGDLHRRAVDEFRSEQSLLSIAYDSYQLAMEYATSSSTRSYVLGFLGALYEDEGRLDEARKLTIEAVFHAQTARADAQLYRWEWQLGRIFKARGQLDDAEMAYKRAVVILDRVRPNLVLGSANDFATLVAPVYAEYADVLLLQSVSASSQNSSQTILTEVRNQLETLKRGEIEDYFDDQCVVTTNVENGPGTSLETRVAVIYPVFMEDRIEILVEVGGSMLQFTTPVGSGEVTRTIRQLRLNLERSNSGDAYLEPAQKLYQWLIAPTVTLLERTNVQTLMMVPGGALRTIPVAALHDGDQFLVERYAVANTPAIGLLEGPEKSDASGLLIGGLTESVQGFSELPGVEREVEMVSSMYPGQAMLNEAFRLGVVEQELVSSNFSIAHFATHGQFSEDFTQSFILTYDDKLTLNKLQSILDERGDDPLDLLVLSACETAAGDDRAALGLAGVAIQSGAKSAIASLWYISDTATAELISTFYRELSSKGSTKAESLRQAQLSLLATEEFSHPSYWAPFLLIGSWQ